MLNLGPLYGVPRIREELISTRSTVMAIPWEHLKFL